VGALFNGREEAMSVLVGELRAPSAAEQELSWFFECSDAAMGITSNFMPLMEMAMTGVKGTLSDPADTSIESRLEAVHAARVIRERLQRMPREDAEVLCAVYEAR